MTYAIALTQKNIICSRNKKLTARKRRQDRSIVAFFLILIIVLFGILYIIQTNSVATKGYTIQQHKSELAELQTKNKNLELQLSKIQSLDFLEAKIEVLNMIKVSQIDYMSAVSEVAAR